jgi:hypothetical protein
LIRKELSISLLSNEDRKRLLKLSTTNVADELWAKEESMISEIRSGQTMLSVDQKYNYEKMLK